MASAPVNPFAWGPPKEMIGPSTLPEPSLPSDKDFYLEFLTQPVQCVATEWTEDKKPRAHKKRKTTEWPLEPPPVLAFRTTSGAEATDHGILTSCPNVFCIATLVLENGAPALPDVMRGRHSSSLFKLEREKNDKVMKQITHAPTMGVFLFDQIHVRLPGRYRILFTLFEMQMHDQGMHAVVHNVVQSDIFEVLHQPKRLPKPKPPALILTALAAQGAKIKIRKPNEDRVKRKQDWSLPTSNTEWAGFGHAIPQSGAPPSSLALQGQMMQPPPATSMAPSTYGAPTHSAYGAPPPSMDMSMGMPVPYSMSMQQYPQVQMAYLPPPQQQQAPPAWMGATSSSHDMSFDFVTAQSAEQLYNFHGSNPPPYPTTHEAYYPTGS